jgi:hypothetical protein
MSRITQLVFHRMGPTTEGAAEHRTGSSCFERPCPCQQGLTRSFARWAQDSLCESGQTLLSELSFFPRRCQGAKACKACFSGCRARMQDQSVQNSDLVNHYVIFAIVMNYEGDTCHALATDLPRFPATCRSPIFPSLAKVRRLETRRKCFLVSQECIKPSSDCNVKRDSDNETAYAGWWG